MRSRGSEVVGARQEHRISGRGKETGAGKELDSLDLGPPEPMDL